MPVIDASVYAASLDVREPSHRQSRDWLEQAGREGALLFAPAIFVAEVASAVSRGQGQARRAQRIVRTLMQSQFVQLVAVSPALAERAAEIAAEYRIRGCDAVYLALAEQLAESLVTLDREQLERGAAVVTTRQP